jgi:hypothetical protein
MPNIQIRLEQGLITAIEGLPTDIAVEVFSYDVAGSHPNRLSKDEDGTICEIKEWHAPE